MIKYPNGSNRIVNPIKIENNKKIKANNISYANRGMFLENQINITNEYYKNNDICLITKRPTPINVLKVDYSHGVKIIDAYFEKQSTTDYNGVYKSRYIDFEAKSTKLKTSFPLSNISEHQITHLAKVIKHGGIAFFIIEFSTLKEIYFLDAKYIIDFYSTKQRSSIPIDKIRENGIKLEEGYSPRLNYIKIVDSFYF